MRSQDIQDRCRKEGTSQRAFVLTVPSNPDELAESSHLVSVSRMRCEFERMTRVPEGVQMYRSVLFPCGPRRLFAWRYDRFGGAESSHEPSVTLHSCFSSLSSSEPTSRTNTRTHTHGHSHSQALTSTHKHLLTGAPSTNIAICQQSSLVRITPFSYIVYHGLPTESRYYA